MADKRKLYPIVGGGFSTNIKKALISYIYPVTVDTEKVETYIPTIISADLRDIVYNDVFEPVYLNIPSVVSFSLEDPVIRQNITEQVNLNMPSVVNLRLSDPVFYVEPAEKITMSIPTIVSSRLIDPVFYTEETEKVTMNIPSIVSASLT